MRGRVVFRENERGLQAVKVRVIWQVCKKTHSKGGLGRKSGGGGIGTVHVTDSQTSV